MAQGISGRALSRLGNTLGTPTFVIDKAVSGAATTTVLSNAAFKFRVLDAWSINQSTNAGGWRITDGATDITTAATVAGSDTDVDRAPTVDDATYEISQGGSLQIIHTGASLSCTVFILCARV